MLLTVLSFLLTLGILVTIHEFGHFYIARCCGIKVIRFSVGFGKPLYRWYDRLGTEYSLAAIPLGGYVKMLDERDGEVAPEELSQAFSQKTVWQRMAVVVAGPVANFILAICLYFVLAMMGATGIAPVLGDVPDSGVAASSGLREGDEIIGVDGVSVTTWSDVFSRLTHRIGDTGNIILDVKMASSSVVDTYYLPIDRWLHEGEEPNILAELGLVMFVPDGEAIIDRVLPDSAAAKAGLIVGDKVIRADDTLIVSWQGWVSYVRARPKQSMVLEVERAGKLISLTLVPKVVVINGENIGQAGVSAPIRWPEEMIRPIEYSFLESVVKGFSQTWERASFIVLFIKKLIFAEVSTKNLSGSFTIAQVAGDSAKAGLYSYLGFLAFLSVSLGVFNLLPIPVLDGGHLLYYVVEAIKGSPVSEHIQLVGYKIGLFLVVSLMIVAHVNDVMRLMM